jgi:hypothetical protein
MRRVRVLIHAERVRCKACSACCSTDFTATGWMSEARAASSSATASAASVLLRFTYALTYCAGSSTSIPRDLNVRAQ